MKNNWKNPQSFNRILLIFNLSLLSFILFIYAKNPYKVLQANRLEIVDDRGQVIYKIDERGVDNQIDNSSDNSNAAGINGYPLPFTFKKSILNFKIYDALGDEIESVYFNSFVNTITIDHRLDFTYDEKTRKILYNNISVIGHAVDLEQAENVCIDYFVNNLYYPKKAKTN
jgi:hypothetical protein